MAGHFLSKLVGTGSSMLKGALRRGGPVSTALSRRRQVFTGAARKIQGRITNMADDVTKAFQPGGKLSALELAPGTTKATYNIQRDIGVKMAKSIPGAAEKLATGTIRMTTPLRKAVTAVGRGTLAAARTPAGKVATRGAFTVGAVSMVGYQVMKGGMEAARDQVHERYMQDYTYSRSVLHNSRVGLASGTNSMLRFGGHQGLSLGLSRTRHSRGM